MLDTAFLLLLKQPFKQAVVPETGVETAYVLQVVQQEEVHIVHLKVLERSLEHLLAGLEGGAAVHVGDLGRNLVG